MPQVNAIAQPDSTPRSASSSSEPSSSSPRSARSSRCIPGKDGLLHICEVRKLAGGKRVENVEDVLGVGQKILVEITKIDDRGKLSLAPVLEEAADQEGSAAHSEGPLEPAEG